MGRSAEGGEVTFFLLCRARMVSGIGVYMIGSRELHTRDGYLLLLAWSMYTVHIHFAR